MRWDKGEAVVVACVFEPMGFGGASFAEMSLDDKNKVSHRGKAVRQLVNFLSKL